MHNWNGDPQDDGDPWNFSCLFLYLSEALLAHAEQTLPFPNEKTAGHPEG